jgi:hypothetical protein
LPGGVDEKDSVPSPEGVIQVGPRYSAAESEPEWASDPTVGEDTVDAEEPLRGEHVLELRSGKFFL